MATTVPAPAPTTAPPSSWGTMFSSTPAPTPAPAPSPAPSMLSNVSSAISSLGRKGTKTYCCDSKTSNGKFMSTTNVGKKCKPSATGQCYPGYFGESYKFRCFNVNDNAINDNTERAMITEGRMNADDVKYEKNLNPNKDIIANPGDSTCTYVTGSLAKVGEVATVATAPVSTPIMMALHKTGGKHKRKSKKSNKKSKKTLRKSRKNKRKTKKH
jgi:hypothetical protein